MSKPNKLLEIDEIAKEPPSIKQQTTNQEIKLFVGRQKHLPDMYDLPSEEIGDSGLPDEFHVFQAQLLRETFQPANYPLEEVFIGTDINLYYTPKNFLWYKRPDWFVAIGTTHVYNDNLRNSYVCWQEMGHLLLAIEFLSPSTQKDDLGKTPPQSNEPPTKWQVYEEILKIPFYFVFDRLSQQLTTFSLKDGKYQQFSAQDNRYYFEEFSLSLGLWEGLYENRHSLWLRWYDKEGNLILTSKELAQKEKLEKEQALAKVERLQAKLKALGIDPDSI